MEPAAQDCHQPIVQIKDVSFHYRDQQVIKDLNFTIKRGTSLALSGLTAREKPPCSA